MLIRKKDLATFARLNPDYELMDTREYGTVLYHLRAKDRARIEQQFGVKVFNGADIESCRECNIGLMRINEHPTMTRRNTSNAVLTVWAWKYVAGYRVPICAECYASLKPSDCGSLST